MMHTIWQEHQHPLASKQNELVYPTADLFQRLFHLLVFPQDDSIWAYYDIIECHSLNITCSWTCWLRLSALTGPPSSRDLEGDWVLMWPGRFAIKFVYFYLRRICRAPTFQLGTNFTTFSKQCELECFISFAFLAHTSSWNFTFWFGVRCSQLLIEGHSFWEKCRVFSKKKA